jgi:hypothetical protein
VLRERRSVLVVLVDVEVLGAPALTPSRLQHAFGFDAVRARVVAVHVNSAVATLGSLTPLRTPTPSTCATYLTTWRLHGV